MTRVTHDGARWSNADIDPIELAPYDPRWPALFAAEAAALRGVLPADLAYGIEHFGSTAIPGIDAKPIIDIMVAVADRARWPELIAPIESLGHVYWADNPDPRHLLFVKGMPPFGTGRTHHVHVWEPAAAAPMLRFRDYLIAHPDAATRYTALKHELARRYRTDREAYSEAKSEFVAEILRLAGAAP
jgi:GrpB-like predicted nucleotidyltransferase (UPF0157 family)